MPLRLREPGISLTAILLRAAAAHAGVCPRRYVASPGVAEDVVQDTWVAVLKGIDGFEGRASLRTWLLRVLINIAQTRGDRDKRLLPVGTAADAEPTVAAERFRTGGQRWPGGWVRFLESWIDSPERQFEAGETLDVVRAALTAHGRARVRAALACYLEVAS